MLGLTSALMWLPLPYAVEAPGPTLNTMGKQADTSIITVPDDLLYPVESGELLLTTVSVRGGPGDPVNAYQVIDGWRRDDAVVTPREEVFGDQDAEELSDFQQQQMLSSQQNATAAALQELGYDVQMVLNVAETIPGTLAGEAMEVGDVITGISRDDTGEHIDVVDFKDLTDFLREIEPATTVTLDVTRDGAAHSATFATSPRPEGDGRPGSILGVYIAADIQNPVDVHFDLNNIGGPSAGLMFTLGVIDLMTPGDMTGGEVIAGTGTMSVDSYVGPIGGIRQKMHGAVRDGATWFLAPDANCDEVVGHVPDGLNVVKVTALADAREAVEAIAAGEGERLPACGG